MQRSDTIGAIGAAMAKAQAAIQPAIKDANNPHFNSRYADLASVWAACRAHLSSNGIAVVQSPEATEATVTVTTLLMHSSGEWVSGGLTVRAKDATPQSIGSAITYCRRFGLASMVGVAPDDDDAEAATGRDKPKASTSRPQQAPARAEAPAAPRAATGTGDDRLITEPQRKRLYAISKEHNWSDADLKKLLAHKGYSSGKDIKARDYEALIDAIKNGVVEDEGPDDGDGIPFPAPWETAEGVQ